MATMPPFLGLGPPQRAPRVRGDDTRAADLQALPCWSWLLFEAYQTHTADKTSAVRKPRTSWFRQSRHRVQKGLLLAWQCICAAHTKGKKRIALAVTHATQLTTCDSMGRLTRSCASQTIPRRCRGSRQGPICHGMGPSRRLHPRSTFSDPGDGSDAPDPSPTRRLDEIVSVLLSRVLHRIGALAALLVAMWSFPVASAP